MGNVLFKEDELKSIIRIIKRLIKQVRWCALPEKKAIFRCVIERSDISEDVKAKMIHNAEGTEDEASFFRYLENSKNYYERYRRVLHNREKYAKMPRKFRGMGKSAQTGKK